jgi:hypothetical protein
MVDPGEHRGLLYQWNLRQVDVNLINRLRGIALDVAKTGVLSDTDGAHAKQFINPSAQAIIRDIVTATSRRTRSNS